MKSICPINLTPLRLFLLFSALRALALFLADCIERVNGVCSRPKDLFIEQQLFGFKISLQHNKNAAASVPNLRFKT